jgi:hypothetical protein
MRRTLWVGLMLMLSGCATAPMMDGPPLVAPGDTCASLQNPTFVAFGPQDYGMVFEKAIQVMQESGFQIQETNRYDGRIETFPRTAPGLGQPVKAGNSSFYDRTLFTFQSYRHRASMKIFPADNDTGFFIQVVIFKELEDLPRPVRATAGAVLFRSDNSVERQFEVIDPSILESNWIPRGRDTALEQEILQRLRQAL